MSNVNSTKPQYIVDTSSIIAARREQYAPIVFKKFETDFVKGLVGGTLWMPPQVLEELRKKDDDIFRWAKVIDNQSPHAALKAIYRQDVEDLVASFSPKHTALAKKQNSADLPVMAWAKLLDASVVTQESQVAQSRIPSACQLEEILCVNLLGMMRQLTWQY